MGFTLWEYEMPVVNSVNNSMDELCICHGAPITTDIESVENKRLYANAYPLLVFTESLRIRVNASADIKSSSMSDVCTSVNDAIIGSDNGLSPVRCQVIIWTNDYSFSIVYLETSISEIWIKIQQILFLCCESRVFMQFTTWYQRISCNEIMLWEILIYTPVKK